MGRIPIGTRGEQKLLVTHEHAIDFLGVEEGRVLATPWMIAVMEWTCRNSVKPVLGNGWDTLGTHVDVEHFAATPLGMTVTVLTEVTACDDRRVTFKVEAFDERERVGAGTHERVIVDVGRFVARLASKKP